MHFFEPDPRQPTQLPPELVAAYRATRYGVQPPVWPRPLPEFGLRVGVYSPELALAFQRMDVGSAAYITACNPWGQSLPDGENAQRQQALRHAIEALGLTCWPGQGQGDDGLWPPEASWLVLGAGGAVARQLARQFEQNAWVWAGADAVPQLVLMR